MGICPTPLQEDTLKDRLRDSLKEIETGNNPCIGATILHSDEVLACLRTTGGRATRNVLKCRQNLVDYKCSPARKDSTTSNVVAKSDGPLAKKSPSPYYHYTQTLDKSQNASKDKNINALTEHVKGGLSNLGGGGAGS